MKIRFSSIIDTANKSYRFLYNQVTTKHDFMDYQYYLHLKSTKSKKDQRLIIINKNYYD